MHDARTILLQYYADFSGFSEVQDRFQCSNSCANVSMASVLRIHRNSVYRWKKSEVVVGGGMYHVDVYTCLVNRTVKFCFYGLTVWNNLLSALRESSPSWNMFERRLETYLLNSAQHHPTPLSRFCKSGSFYKYHDLLIR